MKNLNLFLAAAILLFTLPTVAQWTPSGNHIYNTNSGYVGIGINSPTNLLHAAKNMTAAQIIIENLGGTGGAGFTMIDVNSTANWKLKATQYGGFKIRDDASGLDVFTIEQNSGADVIYVKTGGNIGIGTTNPTSKLAVNGKIDCKEVEIYLSGWSDFVFEEDYQLKPLDELENFIRDNKHLPGIPTEEEVLHKGISVGQMNATLLEKIEELTLYIIDLKKENEEIKKEIKKFMEE